MTPGLMPSRSIIHENCIGTPWSTEYANWTNATNIRESTVAKARLVPSRYAETYGPAANANMIPSTSRSAPAKSAHSTPMSPD